MAQALPDPSAFASIGWVVVIIAAIAFGTTGVLNLVDRARGKSPEPPNSQLQQSVKQLNARIRILEEWRERLIAKMETDKMEMLQAGEDRASRIHSHIELDRRERDEKIESLRKEVSDGFQSVSRALGRQEGKIGL